MGGLPRRSGARRRLLSRSSLGVGGSTIARLTRRCRRTGASVAALPLAPAAERHYRYTAMATDNLDRTTERRIARIQEILNAHGDTEDFVEAGTLALAVLHDTIGTGHPLAAAIAPAVEKRDWFSLTGSCRTLVTIFKDGGLQSPRLRIAHESDGDILVVAKNQLGAVETTGDPGQKQMRLAIAAFLAGAALEDAMRRLCDSEGIAYDSANTSLSKLQQALYSPGKRVEVITAADNKNVTAWGETRNNADHGNFQALSLTNVTVMTMGVEEFLNRHLP
jgi:hypothetical protein